MFMSAIVFLHKLSVPTLHVYLLPCNYPNPETFQDGHVHWNGRI